MFKIMSLSNNLINKATLMNNKIFSRKFEFRSAFI